MMAKKTYMERLAENMKQSAGRIALRDGQHPEGVTFGEVAEKSGRVYAWLKNHRIGREKIVLVKLPRGAEGFIAAIGVLRAGAAYTLVEAGYPEERVSFIAKDCGCALCIDSDLYGQMMACPPEEGYEAAEEHDAAFAVYTSGTTGNPKGVLHERGQLTLFLESAQYRDDPFCTPDDRFMLLSPMNFVASTLLLLLTTAHGGELAVVDYDTVRNPAKLLAYMTENRITAGFMTPSLVRAFAGGKDTTGEHHPFNPEFRILFLSSEPARNICYRDLKIYNVFAQSEMGFLGGVFRVEKPWEVTPIGRSSIPGYHLCLRDVSAGMGEVCIENTYFRGYINLPEMTEYALRDGIYHSGDIGRMMESGDIVLLGRNDDMVKINGNRVEPAEIEAAAKQALGVNWCAARAFVKPDRAYICVYYQEDVQVDEGAVIREMAEKLPPYMVPACLMKIDRIPVNANGKMNRKALPEPEILEQEAEYTPPENADEERICRAFARVLNLSRVSVTDDFYRIGGDSLKTIRLMTDPDLEGITSTDVFRERTARALAALLARKKTEKPETAEELRAREAEARKKAYPLTAVQQNFFDIQMKHPESLMWVLPALYAFPPEAEEQVLAAAEAVIRNHPIFGTILTREEDGTVLQAYRPESILPVRPETGTEEGILRIQRTLADPDLPFRMLGHPLAKIRVIRTEKQVYLYLLVHHVMTDGTGMLAMLKSIRAAFRGEEPLPDGYYSWLAEQETLKGSPEWEEARERMEALYTGTEWTGQIRPNGQEPGEENTVVGNFIPVSEEELQAREQQTGLSRTGLCATAMLLALARHTGRKDILINWVFSNRGDPQLDGISGMLIRSLALGIRFDRYQTLGEVYHEVREQMLDNISHSAYEWCLHHPPKAEDDRLFFVYEGRITDFDILREIGGVQMPLMTANQAVVHSMSAQVLDWEKAGVKGILLACYCNKNMFDTAETDRLKTIIHEAALLVLKMQDSGNVTIKGILEM